MAMITLEKDTADIIEQCTEFLGKSSRRYSKPLTRATNDLRRYSGNFWDDELRKQYRRGKKRTCLQLNNWNVMCNAIASPLSSSPWHTELKNKEGEFKQIQDAIDQLEAKSDVKTALLDAFRKAVLTGYGFLVISTDVDEYTGEPTIVVESVKHLQSVAMDPSCVTVSGIDAEEGAVVNFISLKRARRLYGEEVAPFDYPAAQPKLSLNGMEQWGCPEDQIAIVSYYVKEGDGVHFYKICGDKVVQDAFLPIKHIPIIRLAGNEIYNNENIDYNGLVQMTMSLELGANIAYSTLIERCGRSTKANYLINVDAIDGLERNYAQANDDDAAAVLWKGEELPYVRGIGTGKPAGFRQIFSGFEEQWNEPGIARATDLHPERIPAQGKSLLMIAGRRDLHWPAGQVTMAYGRRMQPYIRQGLFTGRIYPRCGHCLGVVPESVFRRPFSRPDRQQMTEMKESHLTALEWLNQL